MICCIWPDYDRCTAGLWGREQDERPTVPSPFCRTFLTGNIIAGTPAHQQTLLSREPSSPKWQQSLGSCSPLKGRTLKIRVNRPRAAFVWQRLSWVSLPTPGTESKCPDLGWGTVSSLCSGWCGVVFWIWLRIMWITYCHLVAAEQCLHEAWLFALPNLANEQIILITWLNELSTEAPVKNNLSKK